MSYTGNLGELERGAREQHLLCSSLLHKQYSERHVECRVLSVMCFNFMYVPATGATVAEILQTECLHCETTPRKG